MDQNIKTIDLIRSLGATIEQKNLTDIQLRRLHMVIRNDMTRVEIANAEKCSPHAVSTTLRQLATRIVVTID